MKESSSYYTDRTVDELTKLLVSQLHPYDNLDDRLAYVETVRKRCTELLDQFAQAQQEPPPVEDTGRKGWFLYQREAVVLVNPIIHKYHMLEKLEGKETFRLYKKSFHNATWNRSWHPLLAWDYVHSYNFDRIGFKLFSDDRLAPGDVVVLGDKRWVVSQATWFPPQKIWCVDADMPQPNTPETTFELDDPKDNTTEVPIYGAPI